MQVAGAVLRVCVGFDPEKYAVDTNFGSEDFLGEGQFGRVYKARLMDPKDETTLQPDVVAMKIIKMSKNPQTKKYQKKEIDFFIEQAKLKSTAMSTSSATLPLWNTKRPTSTVSSWSCAKLL